MKRADFVETRSHGQCGAPPVHGSTASVAKIIAKSRTLDTRQHHARSGPRPRLPHLRHGNRSRNIPLRCRKAAVSAAAGYAPEPAQTMAAMRFHPSCGTDPAAFRRTKTCGRFPASTSSLRSRQKGWGRGLHHRPHSHANREHASALAITHCGRLGERTIPSMPRIFTLPPTPPPPTVTVTTFKCMHSVRP